MTHVLGDIEKGIVMENEKKKTTKKTTTKKTVEVVPEVVEENSEVVKEEVKSVEETPVVEIKEVTGTVVNCERLNVRKTPELGNNILGDILSGRKVQVNMDESTDQYYKICSETGLDGYCMKGYIKIN